MALTLSVFISSRPLAVESDSMGIFFSAIICFNVSHPSNMEMRRGFFLRSSNDCFGLNSLRMSWSMLYTAFSSAIVVTVKVRVVVVGSCHSLVIPAATDASLCEGGAAHAQRNVTMPMHSIIPAVGLTLWL